MAQSPLARLRITLYPFLGMIAFVLLSFMHDSFRLDRSFSTFFLPMGVGFGVGALIGVMQNRIEAKTRAYERQLSKDREDAALGRAAAAIAHEVRNPLNAIGMGLQRLQMEAPELGPEHQTLISLMLNSLRRANGIVSGLLSYARPQKPVMNPMRLDLVVGDILSFYLPACRETGISVSQSIQSGEYIRGDRDLISQVVENLFRNAMEAQPTGGFIHVSVRREEGALVLIIRNGGFSLPAHQVDRIFEPYFTTKARGTGLGLPIARRIVEAHGGSIRGQATGQGVFELILRLPPVYESNESKSRMEVDAAR